MNYLAHAYLSFQQPEILVGNMISDFVKGSAKFEYPQGVQSGISLHRAIDEFTDFNAITDEAKAIFRPHYRLYSGPFVDIVYDHFLAKDRNEFPTPQHLHRFSLDTYEVLEARASLLPTQFARMLPFMTAQNWLYHYSEEEGIRNSFMGLVRRAKYLSESAVAFDLFLKHYDELELCYQRFFPLLKAFVLDRLNEEDFSQG